MHIFHLKGSLISPQLLMAFLSGLLRPQHLPAMECIKATPVLTTTGKRHTRAIKVVSMLTAAANELALP